MHTGSADVAFFGIFGMGTPELLAVVGAMLILFGAKNDPFGLLRHLRRGKWELPESWKNRTDQPNEEVAEDGGDLIHGPAVQPITPDNQVAELYGPAVLGKRNSSGQQPTFRRIWRYLVSRAKARFVVRFLEVVAAAAIIGFALHRVLSAE
jgi:hypothetical protein